MTDISKENFGQLTRGELFQKISDICAAVNIVITPRELLEISLRQVLDLLGAQRGSIFILKEGSNDLVLKIAQGMAVNDEKEMVRRLGEGVVGLVAQNKKPMVVEDIATDERFKNFKSRRSYRTPSFICAPLLVKDKLIGVINITDKKSGNRFFKDELYLLDFLASQIALNYQRIKLYEKFKTIVKESKSLKNELGKSSQEADGLKKQVASQEKLASIGKLAGGIAHEFNNPLDGVMRYTNLCLEHLTEDDDIVRGYLWEIKHGLNRMANIVRSLLACSRQTAPTMQKTDVNNSIGQALEGLQTELIGKGIVLKKDLTSDLPEITDLGLERVAVNLIRNAIDAIEEAGFIRVATYGRNNHIVLEVEDNGCGISEEKMDQIFEPFYTTKDIEKGCGLGLTIVSEIVKSYNGTIQVKSQPQKGTTFTVTFPVG